MPVPYQIIPNGSPFRPKIETHINDNTFVDTTNLFGGGSVTSALCVFTSPKGRDNKVITIENGLSEFMKEYGLGSFNLYGQPLMNAYAMAKVAATAGAQIHCLRVMPEDAAYSTATLIAKYKVDSASGTMDIRFVVKPSTANVTSLDELDAACEVSSTPGEDQYIPVKLFTIAYLGRGVYGKNIRFRITNDANSDKTNKFKNYTLGVYRNEKLLERAEAFSFSIDPDALLSNISIYLEDIVNDPEDGSNIVKIHTFPEGFKALYDAYVTAKPDTTFTISDFDPLLGIDKYTKKAIEGLTITPAAGVSASAGEVPVDLTATDGIALTGGSDGAIADGIVDRDKNLNALYKKAFAGEIDPHIKSKNRFPSTFIVDANFDIETKLNIVALTIQRGDCMCMLDCGTDIRTLQSVGAYYDANFAGVIDTRLCTFEPYAMNVRDPYSKKVVNVTSTYWMAPDYLTHIASWNGKHRPMAGNRFGVITGYIPNSIYPVFDEDLHEEMMDELADKHMNVAAYNQNQVVVRKMQNTSQKELSALTEQNNVLVLLDVKRDCERLCAQLEYDFSEVEDLARFNASLSTITERYAAAQVRSITARFDKNAWEAERSIIHLYVEMVHRDLIKTTIIEIDVNRSEE